MRQCDRGAIGEGGQLVSALQEEGYQFPLPFHKDGPSPHEAEAVLSKDDLGFFHHLQRRTESLGLESEPRLRGLAAPSTVPILRPAGLPSCPLQPAHRWRWVGGGEKVCLLSPTGSLSACSSRRSAIGHLVWQLVSCFSVLFAFFVELSCQIPVTKIRWF